VLSLDAAVRDAVVAHARRDHPDEACGLIVGPVGTGRAERVVEMTNAARSMTQYEFEPGEQLRVYRELDDRDEEVVVVYHSHTATEAYPSRTDVRHASQPEAHYVLVSTRHPDSAELRSYRIIDGTVTEEEVRVAGKPAPSVVVDR
jgi:[CysO sulfur-carrier protein]-S-L-cysteine hydrolase